LHGFRTTMLDYFARMHRLGCDLHKAIAMHADLGPSPRRRGHGSNTGMHPFRDSSSTGRVPVGSGSSAHHSSYCFTIAAAAWAGGALRSRRPTPPR
jgi:hypothetical protein